jgi:hypothetical protein
MDYNKFSTEIYKILDDNDIIYEDSMNNRDTAIKLILELKKNRAIKYNGDAWFSTVVVDDKDIINEYNEYGINGIKKMFNKTDCYLYKTNFVFDILFYHYKTDWRKIEFLIIEKING